MNHLEIARAVEIHREQIVNHVVAASLANPFWEERFGSDARQKIAFDSEHNLDSIVKALRYRSPMILDDYVLWLRKTLVANGYSTGAVRETFSYMWGKISQEVPTDYHTLIYAYIQSAMQKLAYENATAQHVASVHEQLAADMVAQSYDVHWHWQIAYGSSGREQVLGEAWRCIDYLIDALGHADTHILVRHIDWLRLHLIQRGLSTTHVQQWLWLLAQALESHVPPGPASSVRALLDTTSAALVYDDEAYRTLLTAQDALVNDVAYYLIQHGLGLQPEQTAIEVGWYLAYLGDSLARHEPAPLMSYTRWMQDWFARSGLPDKPIHESYRALDTALGRYLPTYAASEARSLLHGARQVLA